MEFYLGKQLLSIINEQDSTYLYETYLYKIKVDSLGTTYPSISLRLNPPLSKLLMERRDETELIDYEIYLKIESRYYIITTLSVFYRVLSLQKKETPFPEIQQFIQEHTHLRAHQIPEYIHQVYNYLTLPAKLKLV